MSNIEQTLSIIKPDAVERNLENEIKEMFKSNGFTILREKKIQIDKSEAEKFELVAVEKLSNNSMSPASMPWEPLKVIVTVGDPFVVVKALVNVVVVLIGCIS